MSAMCTIHGMHDPSGCPQCEVNRQPSPSRARPSDRCQDYPNCPNLICTACERAQQQATEAPEARAKDCDWLRAGSLLYRLTDGRLPSNRDEINITMANGSRAGVDREQRAIEIQTILIAHQYADAAKACVIAEAIATALPNTTKATP